MIQRILFLFFFYLGAIVVCVLFLPGLFLPQKIILYGGKILVPLPPAKMTTSKLFIKYPYKCFDSF